MANYYNEFDPNAAAWIRQLIADKQIPYGHVDDRSITEVTPSDLRGFTQAHFFAGVAGWPLALKLAGWPDNRPVWTASLPCFAADTLVLTETGYRPIQDVCVGDKVLTHLGNWKPVTTVMLTRNKPTIKVRAQGVPEVTTTAEHPFYVRRSSNDYSQRSPNGGRTTRRKFADPEWVDAGELNGKAFVGQVLPSDERPTDFSTAMWKIVGRWVADGWNSQYQRVVIGCGKSKAEGLRDDLRDAGLHWNEQSERSVIKFHIADKALKDKCATFGEYAHGKKIPREILDADRGAAEAFLEGYFSGDGHFAPNGPSIDRKFTTVSRPLALGVALLAQKIWGTVANVRRNRMSPTTVIEGRTVNQRDFYVTTVPQRNRSAFVSGNYGWKRVSSVVEGEPQDVWNISVQDDESYCVEGCIVHNCQPFSSAGKQAGTDDERHLWPVFQRLVSECRPPAIFGEQVASKIAREKWFPGVCLDLQAMGYPVTALDLCAPCAGEDGEGRTHRGDIEPIVIGAPHIRQRLYWVAYRGMADTGRQQDERRGGDRNIHGSSENPEGETSERQRGRDADSDSGTASDHRMAQPRNVGAGSQPRQACGLGGQPLDTGTAGLRQDHGTACTGGADPRGAGCGTDSGMDNTPSGGLQGSLCGEIRSEREDRAGEESATSRPGASDSWKRVSFAADCLGYDEETGELGDECSICGLTYAEDCECPGPTHDGYEYDERDGVLYARWVGDTGSEGSQGLSGNVGDGGEPGRQHQEPSRPAWAASWADFDLIPCRDGKARRVESGVAALAPGLPRGVVPSCDPGAPGYANETSEARVMRLKGYGNSIVAPLAAMFIETCMEVIPYD